MLLTGQGLRLCGNKPFAARANLKSCPWQSSHRRRDATFLTCRAVTPSGMPDWAQVRQDTPAAQRVLHFNNAGLCSTTLSSTSRHTSQHVHHIPLRTQHTISCTCAVVSQSQLAANKSMVSGSALPTQEVVKAQQDYIELEATIGG